MDRKLVTKSMIFLPFFSRSLCKYRLFISINIQKSSMLGRLRHQIGKVGSSTSFSTEHAFPNVSLSAKNLKLFINDGDSKENGNNVHLTG